MKKLTWQDKWLQIMNDENIKSGNDIVNASFDAFGVWYDEYFVPNCDPENVIGMSDVVIHYYNDKEVRRLSYHTLPILSHSEACS